jgi:hypothetical protein
MVHDWPCYELGKKADKECVVNNLMFMSDATIAINQKGDLLKSKEGDG